MSAKRCQERLSSRFSHYQGIALGFTLAITLPLCLTANESVAAQPRFASELTLSFLGVNHEVEEAIPENFYSLEISQSPLSNPVSRTSLSPTSTLVAQESSNNRMIHIPVSPVETSTNSQDTSALAQSKMYQNSIINIPVFAPLTPEGSLSNQRKTLAELLILQPSPLPNFRGETLTFSDFPDPPQQLANVPTPLRYRVVVDTPSSKQEEKVRSLIPQSFRTVLNGKTMMQVGIFSTLDSAESLKDSLAIRGLNVMIFPQ